MINGRLPTGRRCIMAKMNKDDLMKSIEEMTVLELSDLVKALEEKFGVSAAAMAVAAPAAGSCSSRRQRTS